MRRRVDESAPSVDVLVFDGREFTTAQAWESAFDAWHEARAAWEVRHPGVELPCTVLSDCPFDPRTI
ncbi:hypothetical protein [Mycobacterium kansasii]|uniref:hypothetical protein n=1 Tax=Mycobacterium kansasii TaxID=1768 RepID=UPI003A85CD0E